jgi:tRNA threonylcarbamoyladenosine biosynthesis protein TsaE
MIEFFLYNYIGDKMEYKFTTCSEFETIELAQNFESEKFPNMVICLNGELGSGKTIFTKGFAQAMEIEDTITSPTFTIIKEYEGDMPLFHMDVYRLDQDSDDIGIDEYFSKNGVCIIEWSDNIKDILPSERLEIKFIVVEENKRVLIINAYGKQYEELCEAVL